MDDNCMDIEFGTIMHEIKPIYTSLHNSSEKTIVGNLIRELVQLSKTDFQKGQRNELAKALLFKLKSNQLSTDSTPTHQQIVPRVYENAESTCSQNLTTSKQKISEKKGIKRTHLRRIRKIRFRSRSSSLVKSSKKRQNNSCSKRYNHDSQKLANKISSSSSTAVSDNTDLDESSSEKNNQSPTETETESESATLSNHESENGFKIEQKQHSLQRLIELLSEGLPHNKCRRRENHADDDVQSKSKHSSKQCQKFQQNSNSKTNSIPKPVFSRAQVSEADFYDQLVEVRRESEIEIAKLMNRKNAELAAVQQEAERKHAELKQSIDKLEEQLAVAVANAEKVRRQSEDQTNQLQAAMIKQLDNLFEQSAKQKEELIKEHEQEIMEQRKAHQKDLERLAKQDELTKELQKIIEEERTRCQGLQNQLLEVKSQLHISREQQLVLQNTVQSMEQDMKSRQSELDEELDTRHRKAVAQLTEDNLRLKAEHEAQLKQLKQERDSTVDALKSTIQCIQHELKNKLGDASKHNAEMLLTEISAAYERGRCQGEKDCEVRIKPLQIKLKEMEEKYQLAQENFHLRLEQTKERLERIKSTFNTKQLQMRADELKIKRNLEKLEAMSNVICLDEETQTDQTECTCVALRVSEVVAKEMAYWQGKSREEAAKNAKKEEQLRLEALFHEKEQHLNRQHKRELDQLKAEHTNRLVEWRRRADLAQSQIRQFESELGEARRLLTQEVETRRQQLSEISQARECERKEWERRHEEQVKRIERDQEEQLRQLRVHFIKELQTTTNRKLSEIENEYKAQLLQLSENLHDSHIETDRLKQKLQQTLEAHDKMKQTTEAAHQLQLEEMRAAHEQAIASLKSNASKDRTRARTAEALLRQHEKLWNAQIKHWTVGSTEKLLPADVQSHLESTIESLRLQVGLLQKRIALMEGEQEPLTHCWVPSRCKDSQTKTEMQIPEKLNEYSVDRHESHPTEPVHATGDKPTQIEPSDQSHEMMSDVPIKWSPCLQIHKDLPCSEKASVETKTESSTFTEDIRQTLTRMTTERIED